MTILRLLSYLGLLLTIVPAFLVFGEMLDLATYKWLILAGTLLWVLTAPFWINKEAEAEA